MIAVQEKVISFTYTLCINGFDGEKIETVSEQDPLAVILGRGNLLHSFEEKIQGLKEGERFRFSLPAEEAYGEYREEALITLPLESFELNGKIDEELLVPGNIIPMVDTGGNRRNGTVISVEEAFVKMDFNHPLAGRDLYFEGSVVDIRDATADELAHGHVHNAGDCGCGGDCGCSGEPGKCDGDNCNDDDCNCNH